MSLRCTSTREAEQFLKKISVLAKKNPHSVINHPSESFHPLPVALHQLWRGEHFSFHRLMLKQREAEDGGTGAFDGVADVPRDQTVPADNLCEP